MVRGAHFLLYKIDHYRLIYCAPVADEAYR